MEYTCEQLKELKTPIISLCAPVSLAKREDNLTSNQIYRTVFMRDRDRVLYSKSFRRLAGKTQVYLSGVDDHIRTRLTHTLEVSQIARTIAVALRLDADLVEAIALGHDLGHTPFGHAGERTLHEIMTPQHDHVLGEDCPLNLKNEGDECSEELIPYLGFKHNLQSLKNAMRIEKNYGSKGLNLTNFTLYGIQAHSSNKYKKEKIDNHDKLAYYDSFIDMGCNLCDGQPAVSLECYVVAEADEIAQRHHDVEDAIRGKLISQEEIVKIVCNCFGTFLNEESKRNLEESIRLDEETFIAIISRIIVDLYVTQLVNGSVYNINTYICTNKITQETYMDFIKILSATEMKNLISYSTGERAVEFEKKSKMFESTIKERVLSSYDIQKADAKGKYVIRKIFQAFFTTPQQLPNHCVFEFLIQVNPAEYSMDNLLETAKNDGYGKLRSEFSGIVSNFTEDNVHEKMILMRIICDYIAGMTDAYAQKTYEELYG